MKTRQSTRPTTIPLLGEDHDSTDTRSLQKQTADAISLFAERRNALDSQWIVRQRVMTTFTVISMLILRACRHTTHGGYASLLASLGTPATPSALCRAIARLPVSIIQQVHDSLPRTPPTDRDRERRYGRVLAVDGSKVPVVSQDMQPLSKCSSAFSLHSNSKTRCALRAVVATA